MTIVRGKSNAETCCTRCSTNIDIIAAHAIPTVRLFSFSHTSHRHDTQHKWMVTNQTKTAHLKNRGQPSEMETLELGMQQRHRVPIPSQRSRSGSHGERRASERWWVVQHLFRHPVNADGTTLHSPQSFGRPSTRPRSRQKTSCWRGRDRWQRASRSVGLAAGV